MTVERRHGGWVVILSFAFSFILAIMPWPGQLALWRPDWTALVLIYWCIAVPQKVGVISGWLVGLIHDLLNDTLLGQQALSLCVIAYLSLQMHRRLRLFPRWQQAIVVGGLIAIRILISTWIQSVIGHSLPDGWTLFYPAVTSMILWPWVFLILRDLRRIYRVS